MALVKAMTKYGAVTGTKGKNPAFTIFMGIPFAKPPIGRLRFAAPREAEPWEGERPCDTWPADCFQITKNRPGAGNAIEPRRVSEDCLYLNVWTPAETPEEKLPVMLWIYGGGFVNGSSHGPNCDGEAYNKHGVILITFNYRCGAFGFLGLKELAEKDEHHSTGNYGLMDMIFALKWVRENIAAFGGDPNNITVFGQSAGAMSTKMLIGSPVARGMFQRAICQSGGSIWDIDPIRTMDEKCGLSQKALDMVGWTLEDLMAKEPKEVYAKLDAAAAELKLPRQSLATQLFQPSMDDYVVMDYFGNTLYNGGGADVDIMCGTIAEEWHNFPYQVHGGISGYEREFALAPGIAWGRRYAELKKRPIYCYFFDHTLPGDNSRPGHGSEMQYTFGTLDNNPRPWTDYDYLISDTAIDYWTSFAKRGDPNTAGRPIWPAFTAEHPVSMHFADEGIKAEDLGSAGKIDRVVKFLLANPGIIANRFFE